MEIDADKKFICIDCIGEKFLSKEIELLEKLISCSYCGQKEIPGSPLIEFADRLDIAFEQHYERQSEDIPDDWSLERIKNMADLWEPNGQPVVYAIMDAAEIPEEAAKDIQQILADKHSSRSADEIGETTAYHIESYYDNKPPNDMDWKKKWANFEDSLKTKTRFFSKEASNHLHSVFEDIEQLQTKDKKPVVKTIGPATEIEVLFRARSFQSDARLEIALKAPDREFGPPPITYARAGRMNANGISVFYGANNAPTALAEIRPPVGSKVAIAKFRIVRKLKVLDLSELSDTVAEGSIFDSNYSPLLAKASFLRKLSQKMTKAIMPEDEQFEYLPTQAVADFLASKMGFDGIIFSSAQSPEGLNIALLNHSSRVDKINHPEGTFIRATLNDWDEDGEYPDYQISIGLPESKEKQQSKIIQPWIHPPDGWKPDDPDPRKISLIVDTKSISIAHVNSVTINYEQFPANYYEYIKTDRNPFD